ncbi:MAG: class I SAM-dependent methyltransferase [Actinomycetes bacterium]
MDEPSPSAEFWSQDSQVEAFSSNSEVLLYEIDLIIQAAALAERTGEIQFVHAIGVGAGRELPTIRRLLPDAQIAAWDVAEPMVLACTKFIEEQGLTNMSVAQADISDLGSQSAQADLAVMLNAIFCYVNTTEDRELALNSLHRLLRPGGTIAAVVHQRNGRADWAIWFGLRSLLTRVAAVAGAPGDRRISHGNSAMLFHHFRPNELRSLLSSAGFDHIEIRSLRAWSRETGHRIPLRSPNPLMVVAVRR